MKTNRAPLPLMTDAREYW